ncbi:hypothetical protein K7D54_004682 [Vibrio parahaemolyticus]|nr:hypothetical protein [Vibrio parahaemolyticus]
MKSTTYDWDIVLDFLQIPEIWITVGLALCVVLYTGRKCYVRSRDDEFSTRHYFLVAGSSLLILFFCSNLELIANILVQDDYQNLSLILVVSVFAAVRKFFEISALGAVLAIATSALNKQTESKCSQICAYSSKHLPIGVVWVLCGASALITFLLMLLFYK